MIWMNKSDRIIYIGICAGLIFWIIDGTIDALFFENDENIIESIFFPTAHEIYMRSIMFALIMAVSFYARFLIRKQDIVNRELSFHKNNLEGIVSERTEQLEKLATIDDLTQLFNRRKFFELAN